MKRQIIKKMVGSFINFFTKWFKTYIIYVDAEPVALLYQNQTNEPKDAVMFGAREVFGEYKGESSYDGIVAELFGNIDLTVMNLYGKEEHSDYLSVVKQSAKTPFRIKKLRIMYDIKDRDFYLLNKISYIERFYDDGGIKEQPILPLLFMDVYQQQCDIIDMSLSSPKFVIDQDCCLKFKIKENSRLSVSVFGAYQKRVDYFEYKKSLNAKYKNGVTVFHIPYSYATAFGVFLKQLFSNIFKLNKLK